MDFRDQIDSSADQAKKYNQQVDTEPMAKLQDVVQIKPHAKTDYPMTAEQFEAFHIVKGILCQKSKPERIVYHNTQAYLAVLLDGNNRRTICRIYLIKRKFIGTISDKKVETKTEIDGIEDIYKFADVLLNTVKAYDNR